MDSGNLILGPSRAQWGRGSGTGSGTNSPLSGSKEDLSNNKLAHLDFEVFDVLDDILPTIRSIGNWKKYPVLIDLILFYSSLGRYCVQFLVVKFRTSWTAGFAAKYSINYIIDNQLMPL